MNCAVADFMLTADGLHSSAMTYADLEHHRHPYASPLFADLHGLPPILLQASRAEILRDDTTRFAELARACGTSVTVELYDDMPHVWHMFAGVLSEADHAIAAVGTWLKARNRRPSQPAAEFRRRTCSSSVTLGGWSSLSKG